MPSLDRQLLLLARTRGHTPARERAISLYSQAGEHAACWLALGALGGLAAGPGGRRAAWWRGAAAVAGAYVVNYGIKVTVRRPRPELAGLPPLSPVFSGLSFPSAHATTSFTAARVYSGLVPAPALYAAALAFAVSRPYLGVHYPSDVAAGALLGTILGSAARGGRACR